MSEANLSRKMDTPIVGLLWYLAMCEQILLTLKMDTILMIFILVSYLYPKLWVAKNKIPYKKMHFIEHHFNYVESFPLSTFHSFIVSDY